MALENLEPVTRMESILNGDDIEPVTREEYFIRKAASGGGGGGGLPSFTSSDVGKVLTVSEDGETVAPVWQTAVQAYDYASETAVDHANKLYANIGGTVVKLRDIDEQSTVVMVISDTVPTIPSMASYSVNDRPVWGVVNTFNDAMTTAFDGTGLPTSGPQCYYIANSIVLHIIKIGEGVYVIVVPTDADIRAYVP